MRHSLAVPRSEVRRRDALEACMGRRHPEKPVVGQTSIGRHDSAVFLNGSSKCVERIPREWAVNYVGSIASFELDVKS